MSSSPPSAAPPIHSSQQHPDVDPDVERATSDEGTVAADSSGKKSPAGQNGSGARYTSFWSSELSTLRKEYLINIAKVTFLVSLVVWSMLALYWGSLYREYPNSPALHGWFINRDPNGVIGQNISAAVASYNMQSELPHITYDFKDASQYTDAQIDYEVAVNQMPWGVLIVEQDATAKLEAARSAGDATYNPQSAVTFVYSTSRNQQTVSGIVLSSTQSGLMPALNSISATLAAQYLSANAGNAAAINAVTRAPQTISGSVGLGQRDLRPYVSINKYNGAVLAATYVGLIYLTILAFNIVMGNLTFRQAIQGRLKLSSLIAMRILIPITIYFWLSLMFTLLCCAFHLDFNGWGLGYGAGFMTFWMISWTAMSALGLMLEAILSLVGPQFIAFGLVAVLITNVSGALLPPELSGNFYKYNYAFIYYNVKQCFLTIFVDAGKHIDILKYWGIILAWLAVMLLTFPIWIWRERRSAEKAARQKAEHSDTVANEKSDEGRSRSR